MSAMKQLSKLERADLRDAWKNEASDFTPWLALPENLDALADALGLSELELASTEQWVGDFKLDILCRDGDQPVIIENQLAETDHKHLGQILAYAAGVGARKVIWVAQSFRPEHAAALRYLNENTTHDLSFFGVQIELWRIADSPLAPKFEVVVKPDDWARTVREQSSASSSTTPTQKLQLKFWMALIERLAKNAPQIRPQNPRPQHWLVTSIGRTGFNLNVTANSRDARIGVELWMPGTKAKTRFGLLSAQRKTIEDQLGFGLDWQELLHAAACRIVSYYNDASIEEEARWDEYLRWLEDRLVAMDRVLRPIVKALP
jgi:hypothetical protein